MIHVLIPETKEKNPRLEEVLAHALEGKRWERGRSLPGEPLPRRCDYLVTVT